MIAKLFEIENGKILPTEHCYTIKWLKDIMDKYKKGKEYLKVYQYLFYMVYPNAELNPFFHVPEIDREETILEAIDADFDPEDDLIVYALKEYKKLCETPISRAYDGLASMLDRLAIFLKTTQLSTGRDGNLDTLIKVAEKYEKIRGSFKSAYKDLIEEQKHNKGRGGKELGYDII